MSSGKRKSAISAQALKALVGALLQKAPLRPRGALSLSDALPAFREDVLRSRDVLIDLLNYPRVPPPDNFKSYTEELLTKCKREFPSAFDQIVSAIDKLPNSH